MDRFSWAEYTDEDPRNVKRKAVRISAPTLTGGVVSQVVPGNEVWLPLLCKCSLVTSSVVANRTFNLQYQLEGTINCTFNNGIAIPASSNFQFCYVTGWSGVTSSAVGLVTIVTAPLPTMPLEPGQIIRFSGGNLDAGDTASTLDLWYEYLSTGTGSPPVERVSLSDELVEHEHQLEQLRMGHR